MADPPPATPGPTSRLRSILNHLRSSSSQDHTKPAPAPPPAEPEPEPYQHDHHRHALTPAAFLPRAAAIEPTAPAVLHRTATGRVLRRSYAELADRSRGLAYYLLACGEGRQQRRRVGLLAPNTPAFLETALLAGVCLASPPLSSSSAPAPGAEGGGVVIVPVNYRLRAEDVAWVLAFAGVDVVVVDAEFVPLLDGFRAQHPDVDILVDTDTDATAGELSGPFDEAILEGLAYDRQHGGRGWAGLLTRDPAREDEVIAIPFTSGTTSRPKGVLYTHRGAYLATLANVVESGLNLPAGQRCNYLWTLPMFHAMGWTFPWAVCAVRGTHVCLRKVDYPSIWQLLKEEGITHFNAAPTVNTLLCAAKEAERLPQPVRVTVAASPPTAHLFEQMINLNLHPVHVYGMTETYGPITKSYILPEWDALPKHDRYANMARQGHGFVTSLPVRVIKMDRPEGEVEDVAADGREIGEIVFEGNICAKGYYKDPEATRKLFAGGVLHSGDMAVWHPDGSVQILDRAKDIIISGGENISSVALESRLVEHPDVLEAGVVAVPDSHWGERPKAYLTAKAGAAIDPAAFIDWARHQPAISRFMVPREVEVVPELPKTSTGKIKKNVLREWARHGHKG